MPADRQYYMDYSGCGNTLNCNHPIVQKFILECLEFWVEQMHVDGFRFDEGSILSRGEDGVPMAHPPVVWSIELSESLLDAKIIAEAWDAAGLYQIGYFPGYRWAEWNGRFRDDIRRFVRGDPGPGRGRRLASGGSSDIYQTSGHLPINSINFVTCHDGFTLNDLVSYNSKHNEANGEDNRDGINENLSWNCGVEGETDDPAVEALRSRQVRNFAAILLLAQGVPMILSGDEVRRTQKGNNNAYCQNNEISWCDWRAVEKHSDLFRFWKLMIDFRRRHPAVHRSRFFDGKLNDRGLPDVSWHGCRAPASRAGMIPTPGAGVNLGRLRRGSRYPRHTQHGFGRAGLRDSCRNGTPVVSWPWTRHSRRPRTLPSREMEDDRRPKHSRSGTKRSCPAIPIAVVLRYARLPVINSLCNKYVRKGKHRSSRI